MDVITCPLCCDETFLSITELTLHISTILRNLKCSLCNRKVQDFTDLVKHLENNDCVTIKSDTLERRETISSAQFSDENHVEEEIEVIVQDNDDENTNPGASFFIPIDSEQEEEDKNDEDAASYFCELCQMSFTAIDKHLQKYHEGLEVVVVSNIPVQLYY